MKNFKEVFGILDHFIWIGCTNFSLLSQEYLSSAISALTKSSEISDLIKCDVFQLSLSLDEDIIEWNGCHADFSSFWDL